MEALVLPDSLPSMDEDLLPPIVTADSYRDMYARVIRQILRRPCVLASVANPASAATTAYVCIADKEREKDMRGNPVATLIFGSDVYGPAVVVACRAGESAGPNVLPSLDVDGLRAVMSASACRMMGVADLASITRAPLYSTDACRRCGLYYRPREGASAWARCKCRDRGIYIDGISHDMPLIMAAQSPASIVLGYRP